jgi:hypothetical protein
MWHPAIKILERTDSIMRTIYPQETDQWAVPGSRSFFGKTTIEVNAISDASHL